jgi:hypothetical protein
MNFYNHALMAAKSGRNNLESLGLSVQRPNDYFCEQVKSDAHMTRVMSPSVNELLALN